MYIINLARAGIVRKKDHKFAKEETSSFIEFSEPSNIV